MNLQEFQKISVSNFRGLYKRGDAGRTPLDHATDLSNMSFTNTGETFTRNGTMLSLALSHPVKRMFLATPTTGPTLLTYDGVDTIYQYNPSTGTDSTFLILAGMKDFCALNIYGRTYIMPSMPPGSTSGTVYVWDGTHTLRAALGFAPIASFSAATGAAGNTDPGVHKFAVSYVTNSGFTTRPGPEISGTFVPVIWTSPGDVQVNLTGIPLGGPEVVARWILVTKADQEEYFYLQEINDNTTTSITLDWFDTDLAVSADDLFDLKEVLKPGVGIDGSSSFGLYKYHGRMLVWGAEGTDSILVSKPGLPEAFDQVVGYIQLPTEFDGNYVRGVANLRDVLYFTKSVGIYSAQDNLDNPSTWPVTQIDGGVGCFFYGLSTITGAQTSLSANDVLIMADRGGLYLFNGTIVQPPLTWKIEDVWHRLFLAAQHNITIALDPFSQLIYCLLPVDGDFRPSLLLVGDYSEGLDSTNIKWSIFNFPFTVRAIEMINFGDRDSFEYHLRLGSDDNNLYRLDSTATTDNSVPINAFYQSYQSVLDPGSVNVFRALGFRVNGSNLILSLLAQDSQRLQLLNNLPIAPTPGFEYTRQINYLSEKMMVKVASNFYFRLSRLDIYGKRQFDNRPL